MPQIKGFLCTRVFLLSIAGALPTGEQIAYAFEEIVEGYKIPQKMSYNITDNAANVKCAFKVRMPRHRPDESEREEEDPDDEHLRDDVDPEEDAELPCSTGQRPSFLS